MYKGSFFKWLGPVRAPITRWCTLTERMASISAKRREMSTQTQRRQKKETQKEGFNRTPQTQHRNTEKHRKKASIGRHRQQITDNDDNYSGLICN